jgi:23S rRNA (adenine-N6)-dimethyltransferase
VVDRARTSRDVRRRALGQNFLRSRAADRLVRDAGVRPGDLVLELGAGTGVLTAALARRAGRVLAIELDPDWVRRLLDRFAGDDGVFVVQGDALAFPLPTEPFRVVSNLPFNRTTASLRRLLDPESSLVRADLVVQAEVAHKRARETGTALSVAWAPWFEMSAGRPLPPQAFRPVPRVGAAVLRVDRRREPLLDPAESRHFSAFVRHEFARDSRRAARRSLHDWLGRFRKASPLPLRTWP